MAYILYIAYIVYIYIVLAFKFNATIKFVVVKSKIRYYSLGGLSDNTKIEEVYKFYPCKI